MNKETIAFIGCGNMARSLIGGLIANGYEPTNIIASDNNPEQRQVMTDQFGILAADTNMAACQQADVILLAVKPQVMQTVIIDISNSIKAEKKLIISIAAGIRLESIASWLGFDSAVIRVMPNTPALIQSGMAALFANSTTTKVQQEIAESIMKSVGNTIWLDDETQMDSVTALSGSGPAYFFYFMEAMANAATEFGLDDSMAKLLTIETALGAAQMALQSNDELSQLRSNVTSPNGTTESALNVFQKQKLDQLIKQAMNAARQRSIELSEELGS
ncbi:MAG: pyrroline-5-carboxylate reductase [Pseudomonadota bacterium]